MSTVRIIPGGESLIDAILPYCIGEKYDYRKTLVVFPGKRPAHFLRKALARKEGASCIPPVMYSIDTLVDNVYKEKIQSEDRFLQPLDAIVLLSGIHRTLPPEDRLGGSTFNALEQFIPLGSEVLKELEELRIEMITPAKVKETAVGAFKYGRTLDVVYKEFYALLEEKGYSTRAMRYRRLAENFSAEMLNGFDRIIIAGFFALTASEKLLFKKLLEAVNTVIIFQQAKGLKDQLADLKIEQSFPDHVSSRPVIHVAQSPNIHGEIFGTTSTIEKFTGDGSVLDERTVIVVPNPDSLFPLLNETLSSFAPEEYNIALGYPLIRTPASNFLSLLMDTVASIREGKVHIPDYVKFILHPYTKNIIHNGRSDVTRILFHAFEEYFYSNSSYIFTTLEEIEENNEVFDNAASMLADSEQTYTREELQRHLRHIHDETIRRLSSFASVEDFASRCIEVLHYIYTSSTAKFHPYFHPFAEAMIRHIELLSESLLKEYRFSSNQEYFHFLREYLSGGEVPFSGTPLKGLQVLGLLETRNLQFDRIIVLDASDDVLPGGRTPDILLPYSIRQQLGLPTYKTREGIQAYYFDLLLQGGKEVYFYCVENDQKAKSRFVEKLLWERQLERRELSDTDVGMVQFSIELRNDFPKKIEKSTAMIEYLKTFRYSASSLDDYLHCQRRFYYRYVLRLSEKEEITGELDGSGIGKFVHGILKEYFTPLMNRPLTKKDLDSSRLEGIIGHDFIEKYGTVFDGARHVFKRQLSRHLIDFIDTHQRNLIESQTVIIQELECKLDSKLGPYTLNGFADRIETRDGSTFIVDYKTGSHADRFKIKFDHLDPGRRETWDDAIGSFQLPLYMMMLSGMTGKSAVSFTPVLLFLGRKTFDKKTEIGFFDDKHTAEEYIPHFENIVLRLIDEICSPDAMFQPARDLKEQCPNCPFTVLCGTQWIEGWKRY